MTGMRVTLVGPYPPPFGGIASHFVNLLPGLRDRGVDDIAVVSFGSVEAVVHENGATIYRVAGRERAAAMLRRDPAAVFRYAPRLLPWRLPPRRLLAEVVRAQAIDEVVQRHGSNVVSFYQANDSLALAALRARWGNRRGVVLTVFGEVYDDPDFFATRSRQTGQLLSLADARLASSVHCARSFSRLGLPHKIEPLYYGVDLDRFAGGDGAAFRATHAMAADETVILFLGRFTPEMGLDSVIDAAPELLARDGNLRFVLAGARGPLADRAANLAAGADGRVLVLHDVPFALQPSLYAAADIVLTPTRDQHACMGMSIKEAMASSKPVIGSAAGGIPEAIVPDVTGLLVPLGSDGGAEPRQFVDAIAGLASDRARRASMGGAARQRAEQIFSTERTNDAVHAVFQSVMPR